VASSEESDTGLTMDTISSRVTTLDLLLVESIIVSTIWKAPMTKAIPLRPRLCVHLKPVVLFHSSVR
jgi:hypothetical protein